MPKQIRYYVYETNGWVIRNEMGQLQSNYFTLFEDLMQNTKDVERV